MKWFRSSPKGKVRSERTAARLVQCYRQAQRYWASRMQAWHQVIPLRLQRWGYGLFFILGFSFCAQTVYRAVFVTATPVLNIKASQQGKYIGNSGDEALAKPQATAEDVKRIQKIMAYFDSLRTSESGKLRYDSMMRSRPGLADSLNQLKQIYQLP